MTAKMDNSFINFVDFIDVALEAYSTAPRKLFEKMMHMMLSTFHSQEVELEKLVLAIDEINIIPVADLDEFYDTVLDTVEDVKLFKKKIESLSSKDTLFLELHTQLDKVHTSLIQYMDRMGQLEVRVLQSA
ncbi:MAG: hypothetical protein DRQ78_03885 [Epsilonproteobacteria bacterium]|nr:MAG: hypothetical protein DRQ78_03885 [Campylobacterota bacterium]